MKKIVLLLLVFMLSTISSPAKDYSLKFNGERYKLLYSVKSKDFGGYLNEYFKRGETYNIWSEMVAVHHFPNAYSPIDRIKDFKDYLTSLKCPSNLTFDDKKNTALIDFVMINDKRLPVILEFNVFKYEKSDKCGSVAVQYAKRYSAVTAMEIESVKREFEKDRKKIVKKVKKYHIPDIVTEDIDKCKVNYVSDDENKNKKTINTTKPESNEESLPVIQENNAIESGDVKEIPGVEEKTQENVPEAIAPVKESEETEIPAKDDIQTKVNKPEDTASEDKTDDLKNINDETVKKEVQPEPIKQVKTEQIQPKTDNINAPVPQDNAEISQSQNNKNKKEKVKKQKVKKEKSYQVINTKEDYYIEPSKRKKISPRKRAKQAAKNLEDSE